jgi:hypothetical protein
MLVIASITLGIDILFLFLYKRTIDTIFSVRLIKTPPFISRFKNTFLALASIVFSMMIFNILEKPDSYQSIDINTTLIAGIVLIGIAPKILWMIYIGCLSEYRKAIRLL